MADTTPILLKGTLDMLVLRALTDGPSHGYGVMQRLRERSGSVLDVEEGSLYPALHRLAKRKLVRSRWGRSENNRRARFYEITARGRRELELEVASWTRMARAIGAVLRGPGTSAVAEDAP